MATSTRLTLDQFLSLPDTEPASEFTGNGVTVKEMGDESHSILTAWLWFLLHQYLMNHPIGRVQIEYRCIFGPQGAERALIPDVLFVTDERRAQGIRSRPPGTRHKYLYAPPTIVIEIMSPEQSAQRFAEKLQFYLLNGVDAVWVVDPDDAVIAVHRAGQATMIYRPGDTLKEPALLPGFTLDVMALFAQVVDE